jgi:hypothetical protein
MHSQESTGHGLPILTVREIKDILTLLDQDEQYLLNMLSGLSGTAAHEARLLLRDGAGSELAKLCKR